MFHPLGDRVAVELTEKEEKTSGGIIIPDSAKEKPIIGTVLAVGKGVRGDSGEFVPLELKVGDVIVFGKWSGTEVKVDGKAILVMKESDVMGVLTNGN